MANLFLYSLVCRIYSSFSQFCVFPLCPVNIPHWYVQCVLSYIFLLLHPFIYAVPESLLFILQVLKLHLNLQSVFISTWIVLNSCL